MPDIGPYKRGDSIRFDVNVTQGGAALDLSTYDIWCTGKRNLDDADVDAVFQVTKAGGQITVVGAGNNIARVNIPGTSTSSLTEDITLFYDVQIKSLTAEISTVADGRMQIRKDVTRAT